MKFLYRKVPIDQQNFIYLPLLNIKLGRNNLPVMCLVDSGATYSFFHAQIGEELGLDIQKGVKCFAGGVTGMRFVAYLHKGISFEIEGSHRFMDIAFSYELGIPYNLLGQYNFFAQFRVCFDLSKNEFDIVPKLN